jgi:hypothetical protein
LTGFHGDHGAGLAVTAIAPGTWDETLKRSTPSNRAEAMERA